jgi:hypothetical protein
MSGSVHSAARASRKSFSLSPIWRHVRAALRELSLTPERPARAPAHLQLEPRADHIDFRPPSIPQPVKGASMPSARSGPRPTPELSW